MAARTHVTGTGAGELLGTTITEQLLRELGFAPFELAFETGSVDLVGGVGDNWATVGAVPDSVGRLRRQRRLEAARHLRRQDRTPAGGHQRTGPTRRRRTPGNRHGRPHATPGTRDGASTP